MAIQSLQFDPNATDDQTGAEIKALYEAEANAYTDAKDAKLSDIEAGAAANLTDDEIVAAIDASSLAITREGALSQDDLKLIKTNPSPGEYTVKNIQLDSAGKLDVEFDDLVIP